MLRKTNIKSIDTKLNQTMPIPFRSSILFFFFLDRRQMKIFNDLYKTWEIISNVNFTFTFSLRYTTISITKHLKMNYKHSFKKDMSLWFLKELRRIYRCKSKTQIEICTIFLALAIALTVRRIKSLIHWQINNG